MADAKLLLAALSDAIDAERATSLERISGLAADNARLTGVVADLTGQNADLIAQLNVLDPWRTVDKTGATLANAAIQAILDKGPAKVPPGRYLIDPMVPLLVSHDLDMALDALFVEQASPAPRDCAIKVVGDGVTVTGGHIIGDRSLGAYTAGSTNEWGYGMLVVGAGVTVNDLVVEQCTGDGVGVVGRNCTLNRVLSTRNRRQGVSVFADGFIANNCSFTYTGAYGMDPAAPNGPCAGIDFEPDVGGAMVATLNNCKLDHNRTGLLAWLRAEVGGALTITMTGGSMEANANGTWAKALAGSISLAVNRVAVTRNTGSGVKSDVGATVGVNGCTFTGMAARTPFDLVGVNDVRVRYDIPTGFGGKLVVGLNHYK